MSDRQEDTPVGRSEGQAPTDRRNVDTGDMDAGNETEAAGNPIPGASNVPRRISPAFATVLVGALSLVGTALARGSAICPAARPHWPKARHGCRKSSPTPNRRGLLKRDGPRFIVVDDNAGDSLRVAAQWYANPSSKASTHLLIDRLGNVVQFAPLGEKVWHAGRSFYGGFSGLNDYSIGVELVNWGKLQGAPGRWESWSGVKIADAYVDIGPVPNTQSEAAWHKFTEVQLETFEAVLAAIVTAYPTIKEVVRRSEISPGRKIAPGPLVDVEEIEKRVIEAR